MVAMPQIGRKLARKRMRKALLEAADKPRMSGAALVARLESAGVIGAWADRQDIDDSSAYARPLREQAQRRERN